MPRKKYRRKTTEKARKLAEQKNRKLVSTAKVHGLIKEVRLKLRAEGKADRCRDVAAVINGTKIGTQKILRAWYRNGSLDFTRWDIRDIWCDRTGRDWSEWRKDTRKPLPRKKAAVRVGGDRKVTDQARQFCQQNPGWKVIRAVDYIALAKKWFAHEGLSTKQIAERLTAQKLLRSNFRRGRARWTQAEVSQSFRRYNGKGFDRLQRSDARQLKLPTNDVKAVTKTAKPTAQREEPVERWLKLDDKGSAWIEVTQLVAQTAKINVPMTDPRAIRALRSHLAVRK